MQQIHSFPAVARPDARVLILGSMPGQESLRAGQYYAHPRNAFWRIMGDLVGAGFDIDYPQRMQILQANGIALWDVLASCQRVGSLDAAIAKHSQVANDFPALFAACPTIRAVFFNGALAETTFIQRVQPKLAPLTLPSQRLPSTSPAHATLSYAQKLAAWRMVADTLQQDCRTQPRSSKW